MKNLSDDCFADPLSFSPVNFSPIQAPTTAFHVLADENRIPPGVTVDTDGTVCFCLWYPHAKKVEIHTPSLELALNRQGDFWTGSAALQPGFSPVSLFVDDSLVLSPYLPLCFSSNRPYNFVDVTDENALTSPQKVPHGVVAEDFLSNSVTGKLERIRLYLPPAYFSCPTRRFPVLYLQHGHGENETSWTTQGKLNVILDNLLATNRVAPMIVVMCSGMMTIAEETESRLLFERFPEFLLRDVIPHVENRYRAASGKSSRAIAGLSMGSVQSSIASLTHQDLFCAVGLFSGFLSNPLSGENGHLSPKNLAAFKESGIYLFRAIGDKDPFLPTFLADDDLLKTAGIPNDRRIYPGDHEWNVWRQCLVDFTAHLFEETP